MSFYFLLPSSEQTEKKRLPKGQLAIETLHEMECKACPLNHADVHNPKMAATGSKNPLVYMLGEAPGADEDEEGKQFVGPSGDMLRPLVPKKYRKKMRWNNCIRTRPPGNRNPTKIEVECCRPSIVRDIEAAKPKAIFGIGGVPLNWATGFDGIYRWRGRHTPVKIGNHECWFFPMLHPAGLMRQRKRSRDGRLIKSEAERAFRRDLKLAFRLVETLPPAKVDTPYKNPKKFIMDPSDPADIFRDIKYVTGKNGWDDVRRVQKWLEYFAREPGIAIDIETDADEPMVERTTNPFGKNARILTVALSSPKGARAFPLDHQDAGWTKKQRAAIDRIFWEFLVHPGCLKIAHNLAFELQWFIYFYGLEVVYEGEWGDTMGQAYVLDERKGGMLKLDTLIQLHFGFPLKSLFRLNMSNLDNEPLPLVLVYNALDAQWTHKLHFAQRKKLKQKNLTIVYNEHIPPVQATAVTQFFGNELDFDLILKFDRTYTERIEKLTKKIMKAGAVKKFEKEFHKTFLPSSHQDVITLFRDILKRDEGWDEERKKYSMGDDTLKRIKHPLAKMIKELRAVSGNKSKYVDPIHPETGKCIFPDGRVHPNIHIFFTFSGRTSSSFPNEQYWPKRDEEYRDLRAEWVAEEGCYLVAVDMGQHEARVIQMAAKDQTYGQYFWDRHDIHMDWTERLAHAWPKRIGGRKFINDEETMKWFRNDVKNQWTFPLFFGANAYSVSKYLSMPLDKIEPLIDKFWQEFGGVKDWQEELEITYNRTGYVECLTGRRRHAPISFNELINTPIQGTASDILIKSYSRLSRAAWEQERWQLQPRMEIHDELVFQLPKKTFEKDLEFICDIMLDCDHYPFINVPLCVEVSRGPNWYDQKNVMTIYSDDFGKIDRAACGY